MTPVEIERRLLRLEAIVKNLNAVGRVVETKTDETGIFARVIEPDRQNLISKWLPVGQVSAGGMRSVACPRIGQLVAITHLGNSIEDGWIDHSLYTPTNPPPEGITDKQTGFHFDDGGVIGVDPDTGEYRLDFKGPVNITTEGAKTIKVNHLTIETPQVLIKGDVKIEGELDLDGIILNTHKHGEVMAGGADTGGPKN